ncbi:MAG: BNR repeat-containing protein [Candidatus Sumerlaeota bacterium]|nr:BNR repeat-containing protein [Candidatus Sumerlaeota bacterium]
MSNAWKVIATASVVCMAMLILCGFAFSAESPSQPAIEKIQDSVIEQAALNFPDGPYGTCINGQTFQQEGMISFGEYQYAGFFEDGGVLCVARRSLPKEAWEKIRFVDYPKIKHKDVHNVVVVGLCPKDGTIHLSFDHHGHPLHYRKSVPGLALKPQDFKWHASLFGPTTSELEPGKPLAQVTYPMFFSTPQGNLQFLFRQGGSGNGDWRLAEYDPDAKDWQVLGILFSRAGKYETSDSRCAYPNALRYDPKGRLHVTWCWRETPKGAPFDLATNHDLMYAYSDDFGRTWKNNDGQAVAALGAKNPQDAKPISIDSPGIVVRKIRCLWGQMNVTTGFVDAKGRPHTINWQNPPEALAKSLNMNTWRYYHFWRDTDGKWHENLLPFFGRKPQIVLDPAGNAYIIFCTGANLNYHETDSGGELKIATATEASGWTDWKIVVEDNRTFVGEPLVDPTRWQKEQILSVYIQEKPAQPGAASLLHVIDYRAAVPK